MLYPVPKGRRLNEVVAGAVVGLGRQQLQVGKRREVGNGRCSENGNFTKCCGANYWLAGASTGTWDLELSPSAGSNGQLEPTIQGSLVAMCR
jgi:hypothetical protein